MVKIYNHKVIAQLYENYKGCRKEYSLSLRNNN